MARKQWAWSLLALIGLLFLPACGSNSTDVGRELTAGDLPSLLPTAEEVGAILGVDAVVQESRADLGQEFEHVDTEKHGLVAGRVAGYTSEKQVAPFALVSLALFETAQGASEALAEFFEEERAIDEEFDTGMFEAGDIGDETRGVVFPASPDEPGGVLVALRDDRLVAFVTVARGEQDARQEARELAEKVVD